MADNGETQHLTVAQFTRLSFESNIKALVDEAYSRNNPSDKLRPGPEYNALKQNVANALIKKYENTGVMKSPYIPGGLYGNEKPEIQAAIDINIAETKADKGILFSPNITRLRDEWATDPNKMAAACEQTNKIVDAEYKTQIEKLDRTKEKPSPTPQRPDVVASNDIDVRLRGLNLKDLQYNAVTSLEGSLPPVDKVERGRSA